MTLAAAVLAGGASRRMGRTKALVEVAGIAMADRVIAAARSVGAAPVVVVGGDPDELANLDAEVVADLHPGEGPVGGVLTALTHFAGTADRVLVLSCDLPAIDADTLRPLVHAEAGDGFSMVWVAASDRLEPMCAVWSTAASAEIRERFESGERALHAVIRSMPHAAVTVEASGLHNVNSPDDLPGPG